MRPLIAAVVACGVCLACSNDAADSPTGPTVIATASAVSAADTSSFDGTWRGTYEDVSCSPRTMPCSGPMRPNSHSIEIAIRSRVGRVSGTLFSSDFGFGHNAPSFPITGVIDERGQLQLQGRTTFSSPCGFGALSSIPLGEVEIQHWTLRFDGRRRLIGDFRRAATHITSACDVLRFVIDSRIPWLDRVS